jgi:hypothetical protein
LKECCLFDDLYKRFLKQVWGYLCPVQTALAADVTESEEPILASSATYFRLTVTMLAAEKNTAFETAIFIEQIEDIYFFYFPAVLSEHTSFFFSQN